MTPRTPLDPELLLAHAPYVRSLARELVFDADLARDVEQETLLAALEHAPRELGALRGWLAAVARNFALRAWRSSARRARREEAGARPAAVVPSPDEILEGEELRRKLVEGVLALDAPLRDVLILRFFRELPPREVAKRLELPVETVRTRIKRGLELLRERLDRGSRGDRGAWCLALVRGLGVGPASYAKLAPILLSSSWSGVVVMSLAKKAALAAGVVALVAAGVVLRDRVSRVERAEAPPRGALELTPADSLGRTPGLVEPAALAASRTAARGALAAPDPTTETSDPDQVEIRGRVLDPGGRTVADAEVYVTRWHWDERFSREPLAKTRTDPEGRFVVSYRKSDPRFKVDVERQELWRHVLVSAFAPGFGPGWQQRAYVPEEQEAVLSLVKDLPLRGRVIDLEGRPVAGVQVTVSDLAAAEEEELDAWLRSLQSGEGRGGLARYLQLPPERSLAAETGADGRFEIRGLGRERMVDLDVRGPTVTRVHVQAVTRPMETIRYEVPGYARLEQRIYGSDLELVVQPTRPIEGIVRDAESGEPLAGVSVESYIFAGGQYADDRSVKTASDSEGRFRLLGMPKGTGNELLAVPNDDQPYFMRRVAVPDPAGMEPVHVEIELHRGLWITGRVVDAATGEAGAARIHYLPFLTNEHASKLPEFGVEDGNIGADGYQTRYQTQADGTFRVVGLPGPAILGADSVGPYRQGNGVEEVLRRGFALDGQLGSAGQNFATFNNPLPAGRNWPTTMKAIDPPEGATSFSCDLELDPGGTLSFTLTDPEGKEIDGCTVDGKSTSWSRLKPERGPRFDVVSLGPDEVRTLLIHHPDRDLGLAVRVSLQDERGEGPRTLKLAPCASIAGRILDEGGAPIAGANVEASLLPMVDFGRSLPEVRTDAEGRFRIEHVLPGTNYELFAYGPSIEQQTVASSVEVQPGKMIDLGEVRLKVY